MIGGKDFRSYRTCYATSMADHSQAKEFNEIAGAPKSGWDLASGYWSAASPCEGRLHISDDAWNSVTLTLGNQCQVETLSVLKCRGFQSETHRSSWLNLSDQRLNKFKIHSFQRKMYASWPFQLWELEKNNRSARSHPLISISPQEVML